MRFAFLFCVASVLSAQVRYAQPSKNIDVCGKIVLEGEVRPASGRGPGITTGGLKGAGADGTISWQSGVEFFPVESRKNVSNFAASEESGRLIPVSDLKGKVVVLGFWSTGCEPSLFLLGEMAKLQPRGAAGGFEVFPLNFDPEGWRVVNAFLRQDRMKKMLAGVKIFTPALGAQGAHVLMDELPALPMFFIIDREGRCAVRGTGYKDWEILKWLQFVLKDEAAPVVPKKSEDAANAEIRG